MAGSPFVVGRRRFTLAAMAAASTLLQAGAGSAQAADTYPNKPIRLIIPFPPGGATDIVGRLVAKYLGDAFKQPVMVDNKPGAGAAVGAEIVARSAPDGYTLFVGSPSSLTINQSLYDNLPYKPATDFVPISVVANTPGVLAVHPIVPAQNLRELIALAKSKPGKMTYASSGNGNFQHLVAELFKGKVGIDVLHVPYKGSAPALADTVSGQVDMILDVVPSAAPLIQSGKLRALAVTTTQRSELLPDVPTLDELGITGFDSSSWYAIVAPTGTPPAILDKLAAEIARMVKMPEMHAELLKLGAAPVGNTPAEAKAFINAEAARWGALIRTNNIKPD